MYSGKFTYKPLQSTLTTNGCCFVLLTQSSKLKYFISKKSSPKGVATNVRKCLVSCCKIEPGAYPIRHKARGGLIAEQVVSPSQGQHRDK